MTKLQQLIEAAKEAAEKAPLVVDEDISLHGGTSWCRTQRRFITLANPTTILELCALLEKAEEALRLATVVIDGEYGCDDPLSVDCNETLDAIRLWKAQT